MKLFNWVFPQRIDNRYCGHPLGLWLFIPLLVLKTGIALGTIFNGRGAAQGADGIPLDSLGAGGAQAVVALFAMWGLSQLVFSVLGVVALIRYRGMIPLLFGLFLLEHLTRRWILLVQPIAKSGTPPGLYLNLVLLVLMIVGLVLSLRRRKDLPLSAEALPSTRTAGQ